MSAKIEMELPTGGKKNFEVMDGTTIADALKRVPELQGTRYNVRLTESEGDSQLINADMFGGFTLEDGDSILVTPHIVGG